MSYIYVISSCKKNESKINRLDWGAGGGHLPVTEQYQRLSDYRGSEYTWGTTPVSSKRPDAGSPHSGRWRSRWQRVASGWHGNRRSPAISRSRLFWRPFQVRPSYYFAKLRRLCFYTCLSVHWGGGSASVHAGIPPPPGANTPQQMATAADGMHPTGMHSCYLLEPPPPMKWPWNARFYCMYGYSYWRESKSDIASRSILRKSNSLFTSSNDKGQRKFSLLHFYWTLPSLNMNRELGFLRSLLKEIPFAFDRCKPTITVHVSVFYVPSATLRPGWGTGSRAP